MHFGDRRGSGCGLVTQNIDFPEGKCTSLTAPVVGTKVCKCTRNENLDFPTGKYAFLETEEGLDVAWERKILIFLQESVHF